MLNLCPQCRRPLVTVSACKIAGLLWSNWLHCEGCDGRVRESVRVRVERPEGTKEDE